MKTVETILDDALFNLTIIKNKEVALQSKMFLKKIDISETHWVGQCSIIEIFQKSTGASERNIALAFGKSKTEINRMLNIARLPSKIRVKAMRNNVDKWVLVRLTKDITEKNAAKIMTGIMDGSITKYAQVRGMK
jgi:hypothetical protein